ncbi:hypothetical protein PIIN_07008 [Serendipita indica DSM 11827]|uniref:Peroxisomal membrane protein PEX14 n=1 Tax=Serendipita indica (strain DSM 11827) TaxID=1109443 RepID=G4TP10_SERID|nr:hypothetical protein PIIN_07008 [Serendipita indica DSM 11827]
MSDSDASNASNVATKADSTTSEASSREGLLAKARAFLRQPDVLSRDVATRREFLIEKGLDTEEVDQLISETPPPVPPRTYPQPAPSKLPVILYATMKLLLLLTGASVVGAAMYFTYIYPKLAATFGARSKLLEHQTDLLRRLHTTGEETRKHRVGNQVHSLPPTVSPKPDAAETPITAEAEDVPVRLEEQKEPQSQTRETQEVQESQPSSYDRLYTSLQRLRDALPRRKPQYGSTLQDMSDMTALITSKMYAPKVHSGIEGEVRKEIRAAKGLLLNRKTFTSIRPQSEAITP